ncbi:MAG: pyruvate, phosphate dikinase [Candidatus Methanomethylicota archaeon]|nr:MAG: pyruvate, phosphate dikinase [Candidatus Verstraetearchaeota archaeon]
MFEHKMVYTFSEGDYKNVKLLGGKGAGLCMMTQLDLPVPPGIVITTEVCRKFYELGGRLPDGLMDEVKVKMKYIEERTGKRFGDSENPLLVSVRSGAPVSMPGMMDTVLNLGINDEIVKGLARQMNDERAAYDAYRRFLQMFGKIVLKIDEKLFDEAFEDVKRKYGAKTDADLNVQGVKEVVERFKQIIRENYGRLVEDPWEQLELAIKAVFESWNTPRAVFYRKANKITPDIADGTAVNIVAMVFGNIGMTSGTGVVFTRNPADGRNELYGEFLPMAQGEDVVAGIRTPRPIEELKKISPELYKQLYDSSKLLEKIKKEVQDIEFTIEKGKLYFLQTRNGKMTPLARVKTAVDMTREGILTKEEALLRVTPEHIQQLLYPRVDPKVKAEPVARGLASSPGAVSGMAVFTADDAVKWSENGKTVILVREETKPDDVHGMYASVGILTSRGGMTSHAAVVARAIGKPCVVGCEDIVVDYEKKQFTVKGSDIVVREGDWITIDGFSGNVYVGKIPTIKPELPPEFYEILSWADEYRVLGVRANADIPEDAEIARKFGAEGIGLLRTERMFRAPDRLEIFRRVIMSNTTEERKKNLEDLIPLLKNDFKEILRVMEGLPVIIRLFDPPLHEFLPSEVELVTEIMELKKKGNSEELKEKEELLRRVRALQEANPMMGHRGVRVGVTYPEIYAAQVRAILEATAELIKEGLDIKTSIMVPQVCDVKELEYVRKHAVDPVVKEVGEKYGMKVPFKYGTMIEVVRACLTADEIARVAEFFSFGTNDLTQGTFTFSRDDVEGKFLPRYIELGIISENPFKTIDVKGVGKLMKICVELARKTRKDIEIGICGEQGGDPKSIEFCHSIGLTYVSASPYRIPVARLVAAQAAIKEKGLELAKY